jgi:hypothetical protein
LLRCSTNIAKFCLPGLVIAICTRLHLLKSLIVTETERESEPVEYIVWFPKYP